MLKINKVNNKNICVLDYAFQRIGGKYKARILWTLRDDTILRYGELKRMISGVTTKMLNHCLRELESDRLINRKLYPQVPPKVEYNLTKSGQEFIPFIQHLIDWGNKQVNE